MRTKLFFIITLVVSGMISITACQKEGEKKSSNDSESNSHNSGRNCLGCHRKGGAGDGIFNVGGTVYDSVRAAVNSGCVVKITTEADGTGVELVSLSTDERGNFYTTASIDFSVPRHVTIIGKTGKKKSMESTITTGACNSCHGSTAMKAWVN